MCFRNSLNALIAQERSRAESDRASHSAIQQQLSELEKEKMLIDIELKDASARHKTELSRRDATISNVCGLICSFLPLTAFVSIVTSSFCSCIFIVGPLCFIIEVMLAFFLNFAVVLINVHSYFVHLVIKDGVCIILT